MIKIINSKKQFRALGFIEVLIAIVVVSIISAVFLSIAAKAMKELIQVERTETMARIARDGVNIAQEVANQDKADVLEEETRFPETKGQCYIPLRVEGGDPVYKFARIDGDINSDFIFYQNDPTSREQIVNDLSGLDGEDYIWHDYYFLVMCLLEIDTATTWAHVKFWVGDINVAGQITNETDMRDFNYFAVIEL